MLILPLEHFEPFAATLGVMLYPGRDEDDQRQAKIFPSIWLAEPLKRFHKAGFKLSYDVLAQIAEHSAILTDLDDRWDGGRATGELFKALYSLAKRTSPNMSWSRVSPKAGYFLLAVLTMNRVNQSRCDVCRARLAA